jgi:hypothetical protein
VSRRTPGDVSDDDDRQPGPDAEATATTSALAGLLSQLRRQGTVLHPLVRKQLRELGEELAELLDDPGREPGRHRSSAACHHDIRQANEGSKPACKPDPATVRTPSELITALWQYKNWSPKVSWRKMAARSRHRVVHSTMFAAMRGTALPKLEVVQAIVIGCGGSDDDVQAFTSAWHRVSSAPASEAGDNGILPAPVPGLVRSR